MYRTIITVEELAAIIGRDGYILCDCRFDIHRKNYGHEAYLEGHVPTAVYVDLERDLSAQPDGTNGRHPLPPSEDLVIRLESLGVSDRKQVIAYDDEGGGYAARLWWIMKYLGHEAAAVLDGGIQAWIGRGYELSDEPFIPTNGSITPAVQEDRVVRVGELLGLFKSESTMLIDSRAPERFSGAEEPIDPIGGHIPGAVNRYWRANLDEQGYFKNSKVLKEEFSDLLTGQPAEDLIAYCGSGVTACHNLLALVHAGFPLPRLYAGSWSEWSADPGRPVVAGES